MSRILSFVTWFFGLRTVTPAIPMPVEREQLAPRPLNISTLALDELRRKPSTKNKAVFGGLPTPPPGVIDEKARMAMDDAPSIQTSQFFSSWAMSGLWGEGMFFMGYPYLAELAQRPEYRHIVETIADQMTRKWIKLNSTGKSDKSGKIKQLEDALKRYDLRGVFHKCASLGETFGRGQIFIDLGVTDDPDELMAPLVRDKTGHLQSGKIAKGTLRGFVPVDPTWTSPVNYNAIDPLKPDYFVPTMWYVMGKRVHASRLLTMVPHPVPDILKAGYNFGGLSVLQMAKPYVDNWLRTRQSVSDLLHAFTTWVLKTTMGAYLQNASQLTNRLAAFVLGRDNHGLMMVDKESEELANISAPLGTLDRLQAQAQEQMASVSQLTLVWLLGVTPTGLNATTDGEIRVQYDRIKAKQEKVFGELLTDALDVIQLSEFGSIDPEIGYEFLPLWELDDAGRAAVQKMKADTDQVYMAGSVIDNNEVRTRIAADPESPYHGLEGEAPEPVAPEGEADTNDPTERIANRGAEGSETGANSGV